MTDPPASPPAGPPAGPPADPFAMSPARHWGPLAAIVVALAVIGTLTTVNGGSGTAEGDGGGGPVDPAVVESLPVTYGEASEAGALGEHEWGPECDPETGRVRMPTIFAPPCVPTFSGDNGGATHIGVTGDTIRLVNYVPAQDGDLAALLTAIFDTPEAARQTQDGYVQMMSDLFETYGREIEVVDFQASGSDDVSARADAVRVAEELKPFASIGGPMLNQAYAEELKNYGVLCIGCGLSAPDYLYQDLAPYMWGSLATPEQFLINVGDYITNRLNGKKAAFAGSPEMRDQERVFAVVHFEQDPPVFDQVRERAYEIGKERGYETRITETYVLDLAKAPERAETIVAKLKESGATTIIFLGDPIMPIYLTQAATEQEYFPEWVVTGTVLTDSNVFARRYDPLQWKNAFGLSSLPAQTPPELRDSWRLYDWYFGEPPPARGSNTVVHQSVQLVMMGIHLAGPNLTPDTFAAGLFRLPPVGGGPTTPQISFGDHGFFPDPDFLGVDDMAEIWWDPEAEGFDETGVPGKGMWRYVDGGTRYLPGEMPTGDPKVRVVEDSVILYQEVPEEDVGPEYPPPPGAPAAG